MKNLSQIAFCFSGLLLLFSGCKTQEKTTCIDESKINKDGICIEIYQPVCGCDGKTYGNDCVAKNAGVTVYTPGECPQK